MEFEILDKDEVRRRAPLAAVVFACGVQLDHAGRGRCPFHDDHRPSFNLWVDQAGIQRWGCFPCQISGDCFDLVQRTRHVSFGEAVRIVAEIAQNTSDTPPSPPARIELDQESLSAYVASAQARATSVENRGLLCVAASLVSEEEPLDERLEWDSQLRVLGWGVDENANVVMPHYAENYRLVGCKIRAIGGTRWSFPGSQYENMYGCWLSQPTFRWLVVEGETDFAWAWTRRPGVRVLSLPHGAAGPRDAWLGDVEYSNVWEVYLAFDADDEGDRATEKWVSRLASMDGVAVRQLVIPRGEDLRSQGRELRDLMAEAIIVKE